jgi:3-phosphoshikimate 1-carboxyvinyltransferase
VTVPGDLSSAAFWLVAAALSPGSDLVVEGVGLNPGRTGVLRVLERMGLELEVMVHGGAEPAGDVRARGGGLRGTRVAGGEIPTLIDEIPALAVAAAFAEGVTVFADAAELRAKESDRITAVVAGLRAIGVEADERPDGMVVRGGGARAGAVASRGDHRIAMAFAIAGLRVPVHVPDTACVATSYPGFFAELERMRG